MPDLDLMDSLKLLLATQGIPPVALDRAAQILAGLETLLDTAINRNVGLEIQARTHAVRLLFDVAADATAAGDGSRATIAAGIADQLLDGIAELSAPDDDEDDDGGDDGGGEPIPVPLQRPAPAA